MKKILLALSVIVVVAAILVSCKNVGRDAHIAPIEEATTIIVDEEGTTHYYKIVSDDSQGEDSLTVLAEIATDKNGEPITNRTGEYITTEYTTVITTETATAAADDNDVSFDNTDEPTTEITSETETTPSESPTDSDGWINRWY